jgi:hypothetical protein
MSETRHARRIPIHKKLIRRKARLPELIQYVFGPIKFITINAKRTPFDVDSASLSALAAPGREANNE